MEYFRKTRINRKSERLVMVVFQLCGVLDALVYIGTLTIYSSSFKHNSLLWEWPDKYCD